MDWRAHRAQGVAASLAKKEAASRVDWTSHRHRAEEVAASLAMLAALVVVVGGAAVWVPDAQVLQAPHVVEGEMGVAAAARELTAATRVVVETVLSAAEKVVVLAVEGMGAVAAKVVVVVATDWVAEGTAMVARAATGWALVAAVRAKAVAATATAAAAMGVVPKAMVRVVAAKEVATRVVAPRG